MRLSDMPENHRYARMMALKYLGEKLKQKGCSKDLRRRALLRLDLEICMRILEYLQNRIDKLTCVSYNQENEASRLKTQKRTDNEIKSSDCRRERQEGS